jgi:phage/plasmid-associated DNA primase
LVLVDFPYRYRAAGDEICTPFDRRGDPTLRERLRLGRDGQHEAVLNWLIDGAVRWHQRRQAMPSDPVSVRESTAMWRKSADLLLNYIDERLVLDPEAYVMSVELFEDFKSWLRDSGHTQWADQTFTKRFSDHRQVKGHGVAKKMVRSTRLGLSRPPGRTVHGATGRAVPKQFTGWSGIRFRTDDDFEEADHDQG